MFIPKDFDKAMVGNYMKFQEGQNTIRILREPITGYVYWEDSNGNIVPKNKMAGEGGKPMRTRDFEEISLEARSAMKGFAAMIVWNYQMSKIQILEVKQVGIINSLEALVKSKSWGDVTSFDIIITKTKTGPNPTDVEYSVMPEPKKAMSKEVKTAFDTTKINLEALYEGEDPFTQGESQGIEVDKIAEDLDA